MITPQNISESLISKMRTNLKKPNLWRKGKAFKRRIANREFEKPYSSAIANIPVDVEQLWIDYKSSQQQGNGDVYRKQLIETYLPLVEYNAERVHRRLPVGVVELDDLISAGVFGLMDAIDAFDLSRGVRFESYCPPRIRGAILDELRRQDYAPRLVREHCSKYKDVKKDLESLAKEHVRDEEVSEELKRTLGEKSAAEIITDQHQLCFTVSLQEEVEITDSPRCFRGEDFLTDGKSKSPSQRAENIDFLRTITQGLTQNERQVIIGYYYLDETMKEIAETLDLSESRISQMHTLIIGKLQKRAEKDKRLRDYLTGYMSSKKVA